MPFISGASVMAKMLEDHWRGILNDSLEIIKFTLGSYNVGQGHVEDAMRLAEKYRQGNFQAGKTK